jgi:tetratricopeptide (TPR) repeat protein
MGKIRAIHSVAVGLMLACGSAAAGDLQAGIKLYNEGKYAEAEAALRGVEGAEASAYLAASLARQKKFTAAEATAKAALEADPMQPVAVAGLGQSLVGQEKYDEAIERMSGVLAKKQDLAYAYFWRGMAYNKRKQTARMVDDFQAFLKLEPEAPEAVTVKQMLGSVQ